MAHYRAGQWEPARAALADFMTKDPHDTWLGHPLMAMIEHRLGHAKEASEQLAQARRTARRASRAGERVRLAFFDDGWFEYDHFYREAVSIIEPKARCSSAAGMGPTRAA